MSAEQAVTLADRLAVRTGEAHVVIHTDSGYQAVPAVSAVGCYWLEVVLPCE